MSALFRVGVIACTLLFPYGLALAVPQSQQAQPVPGRPRSESAPVSPESKSSFADALRASTRNDPANFVPSVETIQEFLTGPHTGPVEDAVVGVEVINKAKDGATETRHCSGLLIRCDGFFAIPPAITALQMSGGTEAVRQTVRVTLHPGTPKEQTAQAYIRHYIIHGIDITVMKVQGVHSPAARPLLPDQLKPGDKVELAWTDWDAGTGRFSTVKHRLANLGQPDLAESAIDGGLISFTAMQDGVAGGAAVIGPDGMAIGILPGSSARHDRFTSFSVLARITNCVAAAPTTDEEFARLQKLEKQNDEPAADGAAADPPPANADGAPTVDAATKPKHPKNDMVDVPGGPVRLPAAFQRDQQDMCAEVIACVPAFKIDRYKVSNREYYDFWMSLPEKDRAKREVRSALYPVSWADTDPPFPAEIDDVPVIGVSVAAAQAFAKSKGKRLATTYEWTRAVFGPFGDAALPAWVTEYMRQRQEAWRRIAIAHVQRIAQQITPRVKEYWANQELDQSARKIDRRAPLPQPRPLDPPRGVPFFTSDDRFSEDCIWSVQMVEAETKLLREQWINPLYLLPSGSRPYDTSPYGLMDVLLNGNERVVHSPEPFFGVDRDRGGRPTAAGLGFGFTDQWITQQGYPFVPLEIPRNLHSAFGEETCACAFLISRRLVSSSSQVRPSEREFAPSDSELYTEYRARIYEEMLMALPLELAQVTSVRYDSMATDAWGENTIAQKLVPKVQPPGIRVDLSPGFTIALSRSSHTHAPEDTVFSPDLGKRLAGESGHAVTIAEHDGSKQGSIGGRTRVLHFAVQEHFGDETIIGGLFSGMRRDEAIPIFGGVYFNETWFYPLLAGLSPFMTREMGRDWAKDPPVHIGPWPELNQTLTQPPDVFLVANGFRCAR